MVEKGLANEPSFLDEERRKLMTLYVQGILDEDIYLEFATRSLANKTYQEVCALLEECINRKVLKQDLSSSCKGLICQQHQGRPMVIICCHCIKFIHRNNGKKAPSVIPNVVGIELMESSGQYSARLFLGLRVIRMAKVVSLNEWLEQHGLRTTIVKMVLTRLMIYLNMKWRNALRLVNPHERLSVRPRNLLHGVRSTDFSIGRNNRYNHKQALIFGGEKHIGFHRQIYLRASGFL
ncbi:HAD-IB family hydrolase [Vibrio chagasii]|nr:HAD-IB family hydrolase [Vibrio chagasii]